MFDVIIVGAGPAGISCAIRCRELNLNPLLLEQAVVANTIADYHEGKKMFGVVGFFQGSPQELIEFYEKDLKRADVDLREHHKVTRIRKKAGCFEVIASGEVFKSKSVVLAIGMQGIPQKLGVCGEDKKHVHYKLGDMKSYAGKNVLVVGGGDTAVESAVSLSKAGANVVLSYRRPDFFRVKELNLKNLSESGVVVKFSTCVAEIKNKSVTLRHTTNDSTEDCKADEVLVFLGTLKNVDFLKEMGLEMDPEGNIVHDESTFETNVKGLFIAGDITKEKSKLIMPAMYHGLVVASSVLNYKMKNK